MGLDMYLDKSYYCYNMEPNVSEITFTQRGYNNNADTQYTIQLNQLSAIEKRVMTWRKANAIHKWFVDNVQEGNDDCKSYYVSRENLEKLQDICDKVSRLRYEDLSEDELEDKCSELLPTQKGFFFGSTCYKDDYFADVNDTLERLTEEINSEEYKDYRWSYYYSSSW